MTPDDESAARNRALAIVACADPRIRQLLTSVLSEFRLDPVLPETIDDAKRLLIQEETVIAFVQPRFSEGTFREVLGAVGCPKSPVPVIVCSKFYDINIQEKRCRRVPSTILLFRFVVRKSLGLLTMRLGVTHRPQPPALREKADPCRKIAIDMARPSS